MRSTAPSSRTARWLATLLLALLPLTQLLAAAHAYAHRDAGASVVHRDASGKLHVCEQCLAVAALAHAATDTVAVLPAAAPSFEPVAQPAPLGIGRRWALHKRSRAPPALA
ncbi:MAG: hypothetical protein KGJ44_05260 [Betaproteobacteria bacterium]|nr:hypothetical protein [Betaproteobacteria bacterium]